MNSNDGRIHTKISTVIKQQWENYLLRKHGSKKGPYGPELEIAMRNHIKQYNHTPNTRNKKYTKNKILKFKMIVSAYRDLEGFPLISGIELMSIIKDTLTKSDSRTYDGYRDEVLEYSEDKIIDGDIFPKTNVLGFCQHVDRMYDESFL